MQINDSLTDEEKRIMFERGTEAAFSGKLLHEKRAGNFTCKNCGAELFKSDAKFDSRTGWPSFTEPANREHILLKLDESHGMVRTEVQCRKCGSHLGHVFPDGPSERGGQRYCINSACLQFTPMEKK